MQKQEIYNFGKKLEISSKNIELILELITGLTKSQLFLISEIDNKYLEEIEKYFSRVISGEPIEYILEKAEFYGLDFFVDKRVLVPRNDTEIMVDEAIKLLSENCIYIDIGTGSGSIPISVYKNSKNKIKSSFAVDISTDALEVAKKNIKTYNLENKIELLKSDLLEIFELDTNILCPKGDININNIIITANLPYIKNKDFKNMDFETITFEPDLALYGGENTGFELYEKLIFQCFELQSIYNIKKFFLFIEIGFDQKEICENFLNKQNLKFEIFKDNSEIERCVKIKF